MELRINEYQLPAKIEANFEELKKELAAKVGIYETMVYTEDQIRNAKSDRASLNKLKNAIDAERKARKADYMKPFDEFEAKIKEVTSLIDKPIAVIDKQIKAAEEKRKEAKQLEIGSTFTCVDFPTWVRLPMVMNEKWLNASYKMSDIRDELEVQAVMIKNNITTLEGLPFSFEAIEEYKRTLDLNKAIQEGQRLAELQQRKMAALKEEEEAERARKEEGQRLAQLNAEKEEALREKPKVPGDTEEKTPETSWRTFGGFLSETQVMMLYEFAAVNNIQITEV